MTVRAPRNCPEEDPGSGLSRMETLLQCTGPATRSVVLMRRAGERLGLERTVIDELISPQEIVVFRLPCKILGRVILFWGVMVLHSNARGPYKGGIRLAADVDVWETAELARLMTLKTAATDIGFGGGKTGIRVDMAEMYRTFGRTARDRDFEKIITLDVVEYFASAYRDMFSKHIYIPAPDLSTGPDEMAFIYNETGDPASVTGKPEGTHGWLPGRRESTGYGCAFAALQVLERVLHRDVQGSRIAIQGFGNVGQPLATYLSDCGARIVGVTDAFGGTYSEDGLDIPSLVGHAARTGTVAGFGETPLTQEALLQLDVDVLIPAAVGHVIHKGNAGKIRARAVVEAANMPTTMDAMAILEQRGIAVIPDILANAGGVIASMEEYSHSLSARKVAPEEVFQMIRSRIGENLDLAMNLSSELGITLTEAAIQLAVERVYQVMVRRRYI
ncbi:MAG: Glu/Leu/Phe/Val dehydrogenase [Armatimonadetes bacterium]|nr:Glu/Leu/Phe/Val dehydrogenase [Armatimonadota bacterium]